MVGPVVVAVVVDVVEIAEIEAVVVEVPTIQLRQHLRERTGSSIQLRSDPSCCTFYTFAQQRGKKCDGHRNQRVRIAYTFYPL